ncbi:serine/threonine protein kinase [Limnothrix sp. FACHB-881]|uniref:serine/threonine protein kinase n=1 Tax=Limnothrix sp. FACHB-881 TaxID=2692819 RepID=UPI001684DAE8|nr:serine/threonine-protein kinase [Limnothrix sp. FACHB-881]MBD2636296.1 serine/threonine protein kinase [Limnothrix sp. FACHB-881]
MTLNPGDRLDGDRYEIERVLGCGRFAITYLAIDGQNQNRVAIKTLNDSAKVHPDLSKLCQIFRDEAMQLRACNHPHVMKVDRLFEEDGAPCVVMEHIAGADLEELGRLSVDEAMRYVRQIGSALDYIHGRGFIHRDVRPANIRLRAGEPAAVLIDFGSALNFSDELSATQTASHAGGCAAPEAGKSKGDRGSYTDIYSLGATLYTLLEGKAPPDALERHPKGKNVQLTFSGQYDAKICRLIEKAMALKPTDRPKSAADWLEPFSQKAKTPLLLDFKSWNWLTISAVIGVVTAVITAIGTLLGGFGAMGWFKNEPPTVPSPAASPIQSPAKSTK